MSPYQRYQFDIISTLLIITVTSVALFLKIGDLPPLYPWSDESEIAADAVATLQQGPRLFYPAQLAGGSLAVWLEAGWMALFGKSLWGLRLLNGLVNLASVWLLYGLVNQLPLLPPATNRWLALTASLLMGVSTWTLGLGRIATPNWSLVPLLMVGAFCCFWYSLHHRRPAYLAAMGLLMGLLFYGYLPGYLGPLIPLAFGGITYWITNLGVTQILLKSSVEPAETDFDKLSLRKSYNSQTPPLPSFRSWLTAYLLMAIVASPILIYLTLNPTAALQRPWQLADTNELATQSWGASGLDMLATFGLWPTWLLQGRFDQLAFDPLVTILFVGGLLITLQRWRKPAYLFLLIWWLVMMAPALLSRSASQGFIFELWRRGIGAQPVSFILSALALVTLGQQLQRAFQFGGKLVRPLPSGHADKDVGAPGQQLQNRWSTTNRPIWLAGLLSSAVIISAGFSYELYAVQWANSPAIPTLFAKTPVEMVDWMTAEQEPATMFLFPTRPQVSPTTRPDLFTVRYLYDGVAAFPVMDEATVETVIQQLLVDQQPVTIKLMLPTRLTVDPKGYFDYALSGWGNRQSQEERFGYRITTYQRRDEPASLSSPIKQTVTFGEAIQLVQQQHRPASVAAGESLAVALRWRKLTDQPGNYNSRLTLYDPSGYEISQLDRPLLSPITYQPTQDWPPNSESTIYYSLAIPPDAPPGNYTLRVLVYEAQTGQPLLPVAGNTDLSFDVAEIDLRPNPQPVEPDQLAIAHPLERQFTNGLQLLGLAPSSPETQQPGAEMWLSLWWQTQSTLDQEVGLMIALAIPDDQPIRLFDQPQPLITDYPTTAWPTGQIYRANYRLLFPPTLSSGEYILAARLIDLTTQQPLGEQGLTSLTIEARNHIFEAAPLGQAINRDFADLIRLRSAEFTISADQQITVALQWQALQEISTAYKFFIHLTDGNGQIISQVDRQPQQGAAPTTSWLTNEIIQDEIILALPAAVELTTYRLLVGWYNPQTGERLKVGQQDYLMLTEQ